jgi:hypothetical protein
VGFFKISHPALEGPESHCGGALHFKHLEGLWLRQQRLLINGGDHVRRVHII